MSFLNGAMLAGLAAVAIPVVIHLLNRSRFQVVPWGAMHLLEAVVRKNTRRLKFEHLLMMLLRCMIPAALALLMARPVLTGVEPLLGGVKTSTVILLDNSYSMQASSAGRSSYDRARESAKQILDSLGTGSEVVLMPMAGGLAAGPEGPTSDLGRIRKGLARLEPEFGVAAVPESLNAGGKALSGLKHEHRDLIVVSDFQRVSWPGAEAAVRENIAASMRNGKFPVKITLVPVSSAVRENVSVRELTLSRSTVGPGQPIQVRAVVRSHGSADRPAVRVAFRVDGKDQEAVSIPLKPGQETPVFFTHAFGEPGSHLVEIATDADALKADNSLMAAVAVEPRMPILIVDGDPRTGGLQGESEYLLMALWPFRSDRGEPGGAPAVQAMGVQDLSEDRLRGADVVVLANVPALDGRQVAALETFVREGGSLLVFPGGRLDLAWAASKLYADGKGLLPFPPEALAGDPLARQGARTVASRRYDHPALQLFNDPENGTLSSLHIRIWTKFRTAGTSGASVVAELDNGDPFLAEKPFGRGHVVQCAVSCDSDWSDLPFRSVYVPLMQQVVSYLASKARPSRNVRVGEPLTAFFPAAHAGRKVAVTDPAGNKAGVEVVSRGARGVAEFTRTHRPGLYQMESFEGERVHFVVAPDRRESDLDALSEAEIDAIAKSMGAARLKEGQDFRDHDRLRRYGQELWPFLVVAALALLLAELVVGELLSGRRGRA